MNTTRRGFLKGLGVLLGAAAVEPVAEILVPERKIWAVGANLKPAARPGQVLVATSPHEMRWQDSPYGVQDTQNTRELSELWRHHYNTDPFAKQTIDLHREIYCSLHTANPSPASMAGLDSGKGYARLSDLISLKG